VPDSDPPERLMPDCQLSPLDEIPLPPDPPRSEQDQITDLLWVNAQLREKLARYGRDDSV
jgi:hypothetical protein